MQLLTENGVLAVQMPDNDEEPTHKMMREVSLEQPWREKLSSASGGEGRLATPQRYYDFLAKEVSSFFCSPRGAKLAAPSWETREMEPHLDQR